MAKYDEIPEQTLSQFRAGWSYFSCTCAALRKRGENTGREPWALRANQALPNSSYQLISLLGKLKADLVVCNTPEGQRSAVTRQGLLQTKLKKNSGAHLGLVLQRAESFQDVQELGRRGGRSWAGFAGQAGLRFAQGALGPGGRARTLLHPPPWHSGAKSGYTELLQFSRLSA